MIYKVYSAAVIALDAAIIEVETDISPGLPSATIVGLADTAIKEARERVKSALKHTGFEFPRSKVAINLAPADLPKIGTHYDLPIAISVLINSNQVDLNVKNKVFVGELSLDGELRPVTGVLAIAEKLSLTRHKVLFVPRSNAPEAALVPKVQIVAVDSLDHLIKMLKGLSRLQYVQKPGKISNFKNNKNFNDFAMVRGQETAKRALEIAASGNHNVLLTGSPGSGKTLLARSFPSILPALNQLEALEVTKIYSVSGLLHPQGELIIARPFRSPHHSSSNIALVGGGSEPRAGEITLAHRGVLFLDELPEFPRHVLESLRQPLEDGKVQIARAARTVTFPAKFSLIAAQNPCPCGYYGDQSRSCVCLPSQLLRYQKKISGPLLDRIDLHVSVPRLSSEKLEEVAGGERSEQIRARVERARTIQKKRFNKNNLSILTNSEMGLREIKEFCVLGREATLLLRSAVTNQQLSPRGYFRVLKVARTIADLGEKENIETRHVAEALMFREKEREY